jgi:hypothetical protein
MKLDCWQFRCRFQTSDKYCRHSSVLKMPPVFRLLFECKNSFLGWSVFNCFTVRFYTCCILKTGNLELWVASQVIIKFKYLVQFLFRLALTQQFRGYYRTRTNYPKIHTKRTNKQKQNRNRMKHKPKKNFNSDNQ